MELNSYMSYIQKIILLTLCTSLGAEMLPENGANLNYTQVFFRWDQLPGVESYQFTIQNMETGEDLAFQNDDGPLSDHPALFIKFLIN